MNRPTKIQPAKAKLAVLTPGLGAVATTFIAGVMLARRRLGTPVGSLTQLGTIRIGKRTDARNPLISYAFTGRTPGKEAEFEQEDGKAGRISY